MYSLERRDFDDQIIQQACFPLLPIGSTSLVSTLPIDRPSAPCCPVDSSAIKFTDFSLSLGEVCFVNRVSSIPCLFFVEGWSLDQVLRVIPGDCGT